MIYEEKTPGMPTVLRRDCQDEVELWRHIPSGKVSEAYDSFVVVEQDGQKDYDEYYAEEALKNWYRRNM